MTGEVQCELCRRDKRSTRKLDDGRWVCTDCLCPHDDIRCSCAVGRGHRAKRATPVDPAIVANVDQGAALTAHVLTGWVADYRAMIADGASSTQALLSITHSADEASRAGRKGRDGLVSLVAVAVQQLARVDVEREVTGGGPDWTMRPGQAYTLSCGCGYNAAGVQCAVGWGCDGKHAEPNPTPYTDAIAQAEADGYVFPPWIKTMVGKLEPGKATAVTNVPPQHPTRLKGGCTCPDPDGGEFSIGCPDHIVIPMPSTEVVEPWHGKAVESTYTGVNHGILPGQVTITGGPRPRCSTCYGVGQHADGCRNDPNPPRIDT